MSEPQPEVIPLAPGVRRLGQNESADLHAAIESEACEDCGAEVGKPCRRQAVDGRWYETRLAHPKRIRAVAKRAQEANGIE